MSALPPLPESHLLINGRVIPIMPRLVQLVGLNEAIVLQQVRHGLRDEARPPVREGRRWVTASYAEWQREHFPFWHVDTVERTFRSLERRKVLIARTFNASRRDHTKWYSIDFDLLLEWERACRAALGAAPLPRDSYRPASPDVADPAATSLRPLPATDLLLDEHPLLLLPPLATLIGVDEAIVLQQVRYWLADRRGPLVRDGRRWVRFSRDEWQAQFPFRSKDTVARVFRRLEAAQLLHSSTRYNREPGDRTKAYTIDFEQLATLRAGNAPETLPAISVREVPCPAGDETGRDLNAAARRTFGQDAAPDTDNLNAALLRSRGRDVNAQSAANQDGNLRQSSGEPAGRDAVDHQGNLRRPNGQIAPLENDELRSSNRIKTPSHYSSQTASQEQQADKRARVSEQRAAVVVITHHTSIELVEHLVERGVTRRVADNLARRVPATIISTQLDVYDWLRAQSPDDDRLTPGRLRRMIEEDWASPVGFVPAAERMRQESAAHAEADARARHLARAQEEERQRRDAAAAEYDALLAAIGLHADDQIIWRILVDRPPRPPVVFAKALFYAPREEGPPVIIFRERTDQELATSTFNAKYRSDIARRLCDRFPDYERILLGGRAPVYLAYADVLAALNASPEVSVDSASV